ncbi:MAG: hypothetical protein FWG30_06660 [Eubacteriaceae bacterium]|nr:hypothetical protein [Eubacteriaceae bacterium]
MSIKSIAGKTRAYALDGLVWVCLCILLSTGFKNAQAVSECFNGMSLRFDSQISDEAAYQARQYSIKSGGENAFWPTFWREENTNVESGTARINALCIYYSGNASSIWPSEFQSGSTPGVTDKSGIALSTALASRLYGNSGIIGMSANIGDQAYTVRGIFASDDYIALVSAGDMPASQAWSAVELTGGGENATKEEAASYAISSGLGSADALITQAPASFAAFMANIPVYIMACYALGMLLGLFGKASRTAKSIGFYSLLLAFALLLPSLLNKLPEWMIPSKWSDFAFWQGLASNFSQAVKEYLRRPPSMRDSIGFSLLAKQAAISFASSMFALAACLRWPRRDRRQHG